MNYPRRCLPAENSDEINPGCIDIHIPTKIPVDIIPFGPIDGVEHIIQWPDPAHTSMSTLGFEEAFNNSISVRIADDPEINIKVLSPPTFAILKIIAWNDNRPKHKDDARDLLHIIRNYFDFVTKDKVYDEHSDLFSDEEFDYEYAGARLLGRDIESIANPQTLQFIVDVLNMQTSDDSDFRLVSDMIGFGIDTEFEFDRVLQLLEYLKDGILDCKRQ